MRGVESALQRLAGRPDDVHAAAVQELYAAVQRHVPLPAAKPRPAVSNHVGLGLEIRPAASRASCLEAASRASSSCLVIAAAASEEIIKVLVLAAAAAASEEHLTGCRGWYALPPSVGHAWPETRPLLPRLTRALTNDVRALTHGLRRAGAHPVAAPPTTQANAAGSKLAPTDGATPICGCGARHPVARASDDTQLSEHRGASQLLLGVVPKRRRDADARV
eukprot:scaffold95346_cov66-Phaeocystis_antarctica.AAC.2